MPSNTRHIVLINSDDLIQEMMQFCLETILNCKLIAVHSGLEAIERASEEVIDAILLDLDQDLLSLNNREIISDLKQNPLTNSIPLVLLTSFPQSQEIIKFQRMGEIKAIAKSFDLSNLAERLSTLLDWK